jgi:hypothetical protein
MDLEKLFSFCSLCSFHLLESGACWSVNQIAERGEVHEMWNLMDSISNIDGSFRKLFRKSTSRLVRLKLFRTSILGSLSFCSLINSLNNDFLRNCLNFFHFESCKYKINFSVYRIDKYLNILVFLYFGKLRVEAAGDAFSFGQVWENRRQVRLEASYKFNQIYSWGRFEDLSVSFQSESYLENHRKNFELSPTLLYIGLVSAVEPLKHRCSRHS